MTDYYRRSGDEHSEGRQRQPYDQGGYPPPPPPPYQPAYEPRSATPPPPYQPSYEPRSATPPVTVWPGDGGAGYQPPGEVVQASAAAPAPGGGGGRRARARAKQPVALFAAVAIVAAGIGGGASALVQGLAGGSGDGTGGNAVAGTNVSQSSKGTVAGVAQAVSPSIVEISASSGSGQSTGSGVIITEDGEIVTNNHVVAGASSIQVRLDDGRTYDAEIVGTDSAKDLALIKLEGAGGLKAAALGDSDRLRVGDEVVAIGSPEGLTGTVTSGIVSALDRDVTVSREQDQRQGQGYGQGQGGQRGWPFEYGGRQFNGDTGSSKTTYQAIQTDASLNPGNSGGALINMNGEVIGINSAMYSPSAATGSTAGSVGLGFAIPVNDVKADLDALRSGSST
ncbi:trypsin-like peptidase domain-containing protein [Streptomyces sp. HNM0663]|uniref:Trypsin-like peptidase domain-containing protein n=1 Tax=Streptomyces chengmaiensis TaxID=3040919 RepID=A0ABT6HVG5_9ACTN|nr:trypsin-like peptidase domain-containing protein [Streptomyces chengmaiensis]MDH2392713.1 trypsin-like peptidase domain-containing protein [Streptomyces chengmaiensis]